MRPSVARTAGFSVMEAIIVLAITSLALTLVFTIGSRASEMGFRLGRRALGVADGQITSESFRAIISGIALPTYDMPRDLANGEELSFRGNAHQLTGRLIAARATPCAPAGPVGQITLSIRTSGGHTILQCNQFNRPAVLIADLGVQPAAFSYSQDGMMFVDQWVVIPGAPPSGNPDPSAQHRQVFVRLGNTDGSVQLVALADSGRTVPWQIFDPRTAF